MQIKFIKAWDTCSEGDTKWVGDDVGVRLVRMGVAERIDGEHGKKAVRSGVKNKSRSKRQGAS